VVRVRPAGLSEVGPRLVQERNRYEAVWVELTDALSLPRRTDRKALRLLLLGALNWAPHWYRADGAASPRTLARQFVALVKPDE